MLVVDTKSANPFFNLACEEYLFSNFSEEILFLYINSPAIIIGKHQNAYEEVNLKYIKENNLPLIRRISGGGTVYHDEGNLNFTFIRNRLEGKQLSFIEHTRPIIEFFEFYGLSPYVGDKNEIREDGLKFSGNAEHIFKNRVLHHGTILFSSELTNLKDSLKRGSGKYVSRSVQSNRTRVGNLAARLKEFETIDELKIALKEFIVKRGENVETYILNSADTNNISDLANNKYCSEEWNFGYGPEYKFRNSFELGGSYLSIQIDVKGGKIRECSIDGDSNWKETATKMLGRSHILAELNEIIFDNHPDLPRESVYNFF
jgi:lipoate-protein ligase A